MSALSILWVSVIVCLAVVTGIALHALDEQRRLWFGIRGGNARVGRARAANHVMRVRRALSALSGLMAAISRHGRDRLFDAGRRMWSGSPHVVRWRPQREHAARLLLRAMSSAAARRPAAAAAKPVAPLTTVGVGFQAVNTVLTTAAPAGEGMVRVDAGGQLQSADVIARRLLHWNGGTLGLSDVLAGGKREATALLESVARREVIEQTVIVLTGGSRQRVHITAFASRNRDGSLVGALLILHQL